MLKSRKRGCALCNEMDEIQIAVSESLINVYKFNSENLSTEDIEKYNKQIESISQEIIDLSSNPFIDPSEIKQLENKRDHYGSPVEFAVLSKKEELNSDCDIGHIGDTYYCTANNVAIDAFKEGIEIATKDLNVKVPLAIAWNSGMDWAATH